MKIYKITEASEYLGVSINTLKTLANNGGIIMVLAVFVMCTLIFLIALSRGGKDGSSLTGRLFGATLDGCLAFVILLIAFFVWVICII